MGKIRFTAGRITLTGPDGATETFVAGAASYKVGSVYIDHLGERYFLVPAARGAA